MCFHKWIVKCYERVVSQGVSTSAVTTGYIITMERFKCGMLKLKKVEV